VASAGTITRSLVVPAIVGAAALAAVAAATPAQADSAAYEMVGLGSGRCLDIRAQDGGGAGSRAQTWPCLGSADQRWAIRQVGTTRAGDPYFQVVNQAPAHLCLEVREAAPADGAQVDVRPCAAGAGQYWRWSRPSVGHSLPLVNDASDKCLDVQANSTADGARVRVWSCDGSPAQYWQPVP
jgi:Ricin-type beta-trefoil lectin domain